MEATLVAGPSNTAWSQRYEIMQVLLQKYLCKIQTPPLLCKNYIQLLV
jgi:hypothetical protein